MTVKAETETARAQQREAAERAAEEGNRLKKELAAKEAQLGELQAANAKIAGDLRVKEEAYDQLESESDGFLRAGEGLQARCDRLEAEADELARDKEALEDENMELKDAADYLADQGETLHQQVEQLEGDNRVLLEHNGELLCQTVVSDLDLQQTRDTDTKFLDSSAEVLILKMNRPTFGPYYSRCRGMRFLSPIPAHHTTTRSYSWW
ncbi:hypothetical protein N7449_004000 [Penicillium cf. viridicatum]|uniref:Uncharacterized protein n=1 Tax=Penicillium cf. viridicatum TaxID=2972119 RepID=A0A9W9MXY8_9EURO|nr:hypothetical protein N7449_004000 [Penicillium cf. viridicatum]